MWNTSTTVARPSEAQDALILSWLDVLLVPALLIAAASSFIRRSRKKGLVHSRKPEPPPSDAYILEAKVHHARFLPVESRHQFQYKTLYYALELNALESGRIDAGAAFSWRGLLQQGLPKGKHNSKRSVTVVKPANYLRLAFPDVSDALQADRLQSSILLKLAYELRAQGYLSQGPQDASAAAGWSAQLGQVWAITMPTYLGFNGINPLTVYFVYKPAPNGRRRGALWLTVLEVHNTFAERHVYVLEAGVKEDGPKERREGYDHQWTFPRSFHVSPFNDRGGFYRLFLRDLFRGGDDARPDLDIRLILMVEQEGGAAAASTTPPLRKKLLATLTCHPTSDGGGARPLSTHSVLSALARQPFSLFLTFPRILYEAARLHFRRRLDAFGRPDMQEPLNSATAQSEWDGVGWPPSLNPVEEKRTARGDSLTGGLLWPAASSAEKQCQARVLAFARQRVQFDPALSLRIVNADPSEADIDVAGASASHEGPTLTVYIRSYAFYSDMLLWPDAQLSLLVGSRTGRRWGVSDADAFARFFCSLRTGGALAAAHSPTQPTASHKVRKRFWTWALACAGELSAEQRAPFQAAAEKHAAQHWSDSVDAGDSGASDRSLSWALWQMLVAGQAEKWLFAKLGARYVRGTEPWLELQRALQVESAAEPDAVLRPQWDVKLGSALRA